MEPALSSHVRQNFEKGLRSRSLGDQMAAVVGCTTLLKENPFPLFTNQIVVRLAETFRDVKTSNEVRLCIARVFAELSDHLGLVFSSEEILKRIFSVSHSNDPQARALTLEAFAGLAPLFPESKKIHHLILETLATDNDFEFKCTTHAMIAFSKLSTEFTTTVIERLAVLLTSPEISMQRKIQLVPTFATMKADTKSTKEAFALAFGILETCTNNELLCALLSSMTSLAESTRYVIPEQVGVLLNAAVCCEGNFAVVLTALSDLAVLARHSHVWEEQHLKALHELKTKLESGHPFLLAKFLSVLVQLSDRVRPVHFAFFHEILAELSYLLATDCMILRITTLQLYCNFYCSQPNEILATKLINAFISSVDMSMSKKQAKRFFSTLGRFMCSPATEDRNVAMLLSLLLKTQPSHPNVEYVVEMFCQLAERMSSVVDTLHAWAKTNSNELPVSCSRTAAFLLLAPGVELDNETSFLAKGTDWDRYSMARTALRNGHWKRVAAPNLEAIDTSELSITLKLWVEVLKEVARSEIDDFTVKALQNQRDQLLKAGTKATSLAEFLPRSQQFLFTRDLISAMRVSSTVVHSLLSGLSSFLMFPSTLSNSNNLQRIRRLLENWEVSLTKCVETWGILYRCAFAADLATLDFLSSAQAKYSVMLHGIHQLLQKNNVSSAVVPTLDDETTMARKTRSLLSWAVNGVSSLGPLGQETLAQFLNIIKALSMHRIGLPRLVFHQTYMTEIKLNVTSAPMGEMTVPANRMVPLQVDGVIRSNHPSKIDSVTVTANISYFTAFANNTTHSVTTRLNGEIHFTAQFLISFKQSCHVDFVVDFVDSQRRTWTSNVQTKVKVNINE